MEKFFVVFDNTVSIFETQKDMLNALKRITDEGDYDLFDDDIKENTLSYLNGKILIIHGEVAIHKFTLE